MISAMKRGLGSAPVCVLFPEFEAHDFPSRRLRQLGKKFDPTGIPVRRQQRFDVLLELLFQYWTRGGRLFEHDTRKCMSSLRPA